MTPDFVARDEIEQKSSCSLAFDGQDRLESNLRELSSPCMKYAQIIMLLWDPFI